MVRKMKPIMTTGIYGQMEYKNELGELHREDGPALIYADGKEVWYINGKLHREDGPAVIYTDGTKEWYFHGEQHREDGPAVTWADGSKSWYLHDKRIPVEFTSLKDLYDNYPEYMI